MTKFHISLLTIRDKGKLLLVLFGVLITIFSHFVGNADKYPLIGHLIARKYYDASTAADKLKYKGFVLKKDESGFNEIRNVLLEDIHNVDIDTGEKIFRNDARYVEPNIVEIKTIYSGYYDVPNNHEIFISFVYTYRFELTFSNFPEQPTFQINFENLDDIIKKRYLSDPIFLYGTIILWLGISVSLFSALWFSLELGQRKIKLDSSNDDKDISEENP